MIVRYYEASEEILYMRILSNSALPSTEKHMGLKHKLRCESSQKDDWIS